MAKKIGKGKKANMNDRVKQSVTTVAVAAAVQVVDSLVKNELASDTLNYAELGVGIALPILMPGTERIADAVAAVAAYKVAVDLDLASKVGLGEKATTTGLGDNATIGSFFREKKNSEVKFTQKKQTPKSDENPIG